MLSVIPAKQLQEAVDLGFVLPETPCAASEESRCFSVPQYPILKIEMQIGRTCKESARLPPKVPEPLQLVPSDALTLWQREVDPMSYPGDMSHRFGSQIVVPIQTSLEKKIDRTETAQEQRE